MRTIDTLYRKSFSGLKPAPRMTVSEWAEKYLQLPATSAEPGKYRTSRTPYVVEVMDAFSADNVHKVVVKSSSQIGKSTILLAVIGRYVQLEPSPIMIVQPTLEMAQDFSKDRLERMIIDTKTLTPLFYDLNKSRTPNQTILSKFYTGGRIVLQGANSPAGLASRPIRILLCDEVDRFPTSAGDEGDPISLAEKRQSSYWNYKTGIFSTPTLEGLSRIESEYQLGTQEEWRHRCGNCGEYHFLDVSDMVTDFDERLINGNRAVQVKSVKWRCPDCGHEYDEPAVKSMEQKYIATNADALKNGVRSFYINGFASPWVSWQRIMQEYYESKGDAKLEQIVYNTRFGKTYQQAGEYDDENEFLRRRELYGSEVPLGVKLLTAGVDVQGNRLEYFVIGWGDDEESWAITHGLISGSPTEIDTWNNLDLILDREYVRADGVRMKIARTFIDSGYMTTNVYEYCRRNILKGRIPIKGRAAFGMTLLHSVTYPANSGVVLMILGVNEGKNEIYARLSVQKPGKNYMHYPEPDEYLPRNFDSSYFKQLISERRVVKRSGGIWYSTFEPVRRGVRNEALDLAVYALAAMRSLNVPERRTKIVQKAVDIW